MAFNTCRNWCNFVKEKNKNMTQTLPIRVISRKSNLALLQVKEVFQQFPYINYEWITLDSFGDKNKQLSLLDSPPSDLFTRELDEALIRGDVDIAIHSAKDLAYPLHPALEVIALFEAFDQTDALVSRDQLALKDLPSGARVGTSSPMRKRELLALCPDITVVSIRGTIEERIDLIREDKIDALIVATCALKRLGFESLITEILPFQTHPLQGNLAVTALRKRTELKELFSEKDLLRKYGKVTLVGFGPGNPDLLTIAGERAIKEAEIIFYDDLLDNSFLNNYRAEKIYVGKRSGKHHAEQQDINLLLLQSAREGKRVVRLKGGDPMIFAHGGEEIEFLQSNLIKVEVIPGISTANALASLSKISLTHRDLASSVAYISGHSLPVSVPDADTLVYYMGAARLGEISHEIIRHGRSPETSVLLVHNVSRENQTEYFTTLQSLLTSNIHYPTPLIMVVGKVVELRSHKAKELVPKNILVLGTHAEGYAHLGKVIHTPLIEITGCKDKNRLYQSIRELKYFRYLLFTSRYAVHYFFQALSELHLDSRYLADIRIVSIGKITSEKLRQYGISSDLEAEEEDSYGVINLFSKEDTTKENRVLIPRSDIALDIIPSGLRSLGFNVKTIAVYHNSYPAFPEKVNLSTIDSVVFTSPSCVDNFIRLYGEIPSHIHCITKGRVTQEKYNKYRNQ